jgi:ribosomal protein S18 acetylase RimI-like enzyme
MSAMVDDAVEEVQKTAPKKVLPFQLGDVNEANLQQIRMLNISTLPVRYSDKFYRDLIKNYTNKYLQYAFYNGFVVGSICARVEPISATPPIEADSAPQAVDATPTTEKKKLYIMILNVLAPYRRRGIASELLRFATEKAIADPEIEEMYLHVQVNNQEAKEFYMRHGFEQSEVIKGYYKNIDPPDCFLLRKVTLSE